MNNKEKEREANPEKKVKISRMSRHQQDRSRKIHRMVLILILLAVAVLVVGAIFDIPYINVAREGGSWLWDKISGKSGEKTSYPSYLFLTQPQTRGELSGDVSTLVILYQQDDDGGSLRTIMDMALFTYIPESGEGEVYLLPETATAYNTQGQLIQLKRALSEEGGLDILRSTVNNITDSDVDYLVLAEFGEAMRVVQDLNLPPVVLKEDLVLPNPVNGDINHLKSGQEIGDADRLLAYLIASDVRDTRDTRLERTRSYLPEVFYSLAGSGQTQLEEGLASLNADDLLNPSAGMIEQDRSYIASMIQAFADLPEEKLVIRAIPKVEVVNGCGLPDLGKKVGEQLESLGVMVSAMAGNAKVMVDGEEVNDFSHDVSSVIYHSQDRRVAAYARYLGVLMSIGDVSYSPDPGPEILIIAGKDLAG